MYIIVAHGGCRSDILPKNISKVTFSGSESEKGTEIDQIGGSIDMRLQIKYSFIIKFEYMINTVNMVLFLL